MTDQIFQYTQKTLFLAHFWSICSIFVANFFFSRKSGFVTQNAIEVSSTMPQFRKNNETIPSKCPSKTEGLTEGQTDAIS